jgi:hypothetical protein
MLAVYHLRSAAYYGIWYVVGLAMRTCIDLSLHRRLHETGQSYESIQQRRRLFWTVYSLERAISIAMGRPSSISDAHIDVPFPNEVDRSVSSLISVETPTQGSLTGQNLADISQAVCLFRLRYVESRIHHSIYRPSRSLQSLLPKMQKLYSELEVLHSQIELKLSLTTLDHDYIMLHYNRALRLLLQPFLSLFTPVDPFYVRCLHAAGEICQIHKRLNSQGSYGHSFVALQTVFVAGITILYCLWTRGRDLWTVKLSNDIRACSSVLFVMGERASYVKKYRDAYEVLLNATMERLENDPSPHQGLMESLESQFSIRKPEEQNAQIYHSHDENSAIPPMTQNLSSGYRIRSIGADFDRTDPQELSTLKNQLAIPTSGWNYHHSTIEPDINFGDIDYQHNETFRVVSEVASWMDQEQGKESREIRMPGFDILEGSDQFWPAAF